MLPRDESVIESAATAKNNKEKIEEGLAKKFSSIRLESDILRGNCLSCAVETARVLLGSVDTQPKTITMQNACYDEQEAIETNLPIKLDEENTREFQTNKKSPEPERTASFEEFITFVKSSKPGTVMIADDDDHVFNLIKAYDSKLYLIDSDSHVYRQIHSHDDFKARIAQAGETVADYDHDYFYSKKVITLHTVGTLDPSWNSVFSPEVKKENKFGLSRHRNSFFTHQPESTSTNKDNAKQIQSLPTQRKINT